MGQPDRRPAKKARLTGPAPEASLTGSPPIGAHASAAGGVHLALDRARGFGCEAVQVFVKSPHQWKAARLRESDVHLFTEARHPRRGAPEDGAPANGDESTDPLGPVVAHAAYLINLASPDRRVLGRSRRGLADELARCHRFGIDALIVHPGAHLGSGIERGVARVVESVGEVLDRTPGGTRLLLENTAGQGTVLGASLEELASMLEGCAAEERLGVCLDTCHAFAAGYGLHRSRGYEAYWARVEALLGLDAVGCLHLNDSQHPLGSHRDRHANLGEGEIGPGLFRRLMGEPRLSRVPMVLETPVGDDRQGHARDLAKLRRWRRRAARSG